MVIDKNRPSPEWTASLRQRFPTEREVDRVLTRRADRRAGPPYAPMTLEAMVGGVASLLRSKLRQPFEILNAQWLAGGASKLQMSFILDWDRPDIGREKTPMVLRMEPAESIVETSRLREFQLIRAFEGVLPVPQTYWVDFDGEHLPYPALICAFVNGVTKPSKTTSSVTGIGTTFGPHLRPVLAEQFVRHVSLIHTLDFRKADLSTLDVPTLGTQAAEWQLNWWERVWEEDVEEEAPFLRLVMAWMRDNMPSCECLSLLHGDYRAGNFLFRESDNQITAWLDWELGHIGDRHEDLAWTITRIFGHNAEDGKTFLVGGLLPIPEFFEAYERATGLSVNLKSIEYYKLLSLLKAVVHTQSTCWRIARNGKTHQDVLVAWLSGIASSLMEQMRVMLEEMA